MKFFIFLMLQSVIILLLMADPPEVPKPRQIPREYEVKLNQTISELSQRPKRETGQEASKPFKPLCSEEVFKKYFKKNHKLPTNAYLVRSNVLNQPYFLLDMCDFNFRNTTVASCLQKQKVKQLTIVGDAHARQYAMALMRVFANSSFECDMIRKEKIVYIDDKNKTTYPDASYYANRAYATWSSEVLGLRTNKQCRSSTHVCYAMTGDSSIHALKVEYLNLMNLTSDLLTLKGWTEDTTAKTYEEFLLKIYLKDNFPDLLILVLPEDHKRGNYDTQKKDIIYFVNLVKKYTPPTTKVFWLPATAEVLRKTRKKKATPLVEVTYRRNMALYRAIETDVMLPNALHHTFLNLFNVSLPWITSGQNGLLPPKWYEAVITSLLALPCNA